MVHGETILVSSFPSAPPCSLMIVGAGRVSVIVARVIGGRLPPRLSGRGWRRLEPRGRLARAFALVLLILNAAPAVSGSLWRLIPPFAASPMPVLVVD